MAETSNTQKGYLYPSSRVSRCPRFHACLLSQKCQNFDRTRLDCNVCESRVHTNTETKLGGYVAEGTISPDMQDAVKTLQERFMKPLAANDDDPQSINGSDITNQYSKERKATEQLQHFSNLHGLTFEEKIMETYVNQDTADLLGQTDFTK